jgi:hypothetical protein
VRPQTLAVGSRAFVECIQAALGGRARFRGVEDAPSCSMLGESNAPPYAAISASKWRA